MLKTRDFVQARLYEREEDVVQDALRHLLRARPRYRVPLAISRYQNEDISLAKAAALAGVSWPQIGELPSRLHSGERSCLAIAHSSPEYPEYPSSPEYPEYPSSPEYPFFTSLPKWELYLITIPKFPITQSGIC